MTVRPAEAGPLAGLSVVVTRARAQASSLVARLSALGASVVELPVIAVAEAPDGGAALRRAADRAVAGGYAWVALTSANAAARLLRALDGRTVPDGTCWAAVGPATAAALHEAGIEPDLVPDASLAGALADALPRPPADRPRPVLFPRAETVAGTLAAGLRSRGWPVDEVVAYRTVAGDPDPASVAAARRADAVAFTSSSTVDRTVALLGRDGVPRLVASIGPATSRSARAAGLEVSVEADDHTVDGLVAALVSARPGAPGHRPDLP